MTAGGPPWPILGAGQPEPERAAAVKAGQERADPAQARSSRAGSATVAPSPAAPPPAAPPPAGSATAGPPEEQAAGGSSRPGQAGSAPPPASPVLGLSARLTALTRLIQIAAARTGSGFPETLVQDAKELVERAGERLRLSADHTVVALAGGTGSGKSSIFNYLAGADFSAVGVIRPVTRDAHACVWDASGSGSLLDWLGVPRRFRYARASMLDVGESSLNGLVLIDLPDHDSVVGGASRQVDRLIGMADLMVWVLDPQKYADGAVHRRYLVPLAGHSDVIAVVLNQADRLSADEAEDCAADLRRLLDSEGLHNAWLLVTSAVTGAGMAQFRGLLAGAVETRRATSARISADLDGIAREFAPYATEQAEGPGHEAGASPAAAPGAHEGGRAGRDGRVPVDTAEELVDAFAGAAGVSAVADALQSARELRAVDYVGWPIAWLVERLTGRDPVRRIRLGRLWAELKSMATGPSGAQQADIDNALTKLADEVGTPLPKPWSQTTRSAARSEERRVGKECRP